MAKITASDILASRDRRNAMRVAMSGEHPGVCVVLSLNIPGEDKLSPRVRALYTYAVARILDAFQVRAMRGVEEITGPYAVFSVAEEAVAAKGAAIGIEESASHCRLMDLDVYDAGGTPVSGHGRDSGRACFLCSRPAAVCMRERNHTAGEIAEAVNAMFTDFHAAMSRTISSRAEACAALGLEALLHEAAASPSPGLVDPLHTGAHADMDFFTFQKSSAALAHGLGRCAEAGLRHESHPAGLLPVLRRIGLETEKAMFRSTDGVNTQKGALFSMGLLLGASGLLLRQGTPLEPENISAMLRRMTEGLVERELHNVPPKTAGEKAFTDHGIAGIRGEMERGLPSLLTCGLPTLEAALAQGQSCNHALIRTLIALMSVVDDTTIIYRAKSIAALRDVRKKARELLESGRLDHADWRDAVWELDKELVRKNISPGGSADLLAATWYLHRIKTSRRD